MDPILILTGPTAVGKSALAVELASVQNAEIVSADSRQVYRELEIGTAKPSEDELRRTPHHFINELALGEPYSAGRYQEDAHQRIHEIIERGKTPLVVGGSTLYIHALKHGLANIPPIPDTVRAGIQQRLKERGAHVLYEDLERVDPDAAKTLDPTKTQRLVRSLEVYEATGRPLSSYYEDQTSPPFEFRTLVLNRDRAELYERINARVDRMLYDGLLDEVQGLLSRGFDPSSNPLRTIGYQEPIRYLQGKIHYDEMVRLIKRNTRRYAKRQLTWFRRDLQNRWLSADSPQSDLLAAIR